MQWLEYHETPRVGASKPCILEEYGISRDDTMYSRSIYNQWHQYILLSKPINGDITWGSLLVDTTSCRCLCNLYHGPRLCGSGDHDHLATSISDNQSQGNYTSSQSRDWKRLILHTILNLTVCVSSYILFTLRHFLSVPVLIIAPAGSMFRLFR